MVVLLQICMGILSGKRQFHLTISLFVMINFSEWWFSTCHWFKIRTIREQDIYLLRENKWNEIKNQCTFYELTWCWEYRNDRVFVCNINLWFAMLIVLCINFESLIYTKQNWIRRMSGEFWSVQLTTLLLHEQMEVMCKMYCEVRSTCKNIQMYMKKVLYIQRIVILCEMYCKMCIAYVWIKTRYAM